MAKADVDAGERHTSDFADNWRDRPYQGVNSTYLLRGVPRALQALVLDSFHAAVIRRIRDATRQTQPLTKVVDIACGHGDWTIRYLDFARHAVGFDVNPEFIEAAKQRVAEGLPEGTTAEFHAMSMDEFDDYEGADLVCWGGAAMYVDDDDLDKVIGRVAKGLRPGGVFYLRASVVAPNQGADETHFGRYRTKAQYEDVIRRHGLVIEQRATSLQLVLAHPFRKLGIRNLGVGLVPTLPIWGAVRLRARLGPHNERFSWLATKPSGG